MFWHFFNPNCNHIEHCIADLSAAPAHLCTSIESSIKGKVVLKVAQYPVRRTAQSALHFLPPPLGRPVHSYTNLASQGSISSSAAITRND